MTACVADGFRKMALFKRVYSVWVALLLGVAAMSLPAWSQPHPVTATIDASKSLSIAVLNPSDSEQSIQLKIKRTKLASAGKLWRMAPDKIDATVQVDKTPEVKVEEQSLGALPGTISVRPFSVNIYSYPVQ